MSKRVIGFLQFFSLVLVITSAIPASAQQLPVASLTKPGTSADVVTALGEPAVKKLSPDQVLERFVKAETSVRESLNQHTFKRNVLLQTIGPDGQVNGEYIRRSQFLFDDRGNRIERVLYHPAPSLKDMRITKEDIQDLAGGQLLGIDITETAKYKLALVGTENLGNRVVYAIDVTPRTAPNPYRMRERFFVGRVWVDANTFQIVKVSGKVEPQGKQRFPKFETWREVSQGQLLFPSRTHADDILHFPKIDVHYRVQVTYYDYKLFASKLTITEIDETAANAPIDKKASSSQSARDVVACKTNRTAPPVSTFSWPPDSTVRVYFVRGMFTADQRRTLFAAMADWSAAAKRIGAGVKFVDAGDSDRRVSCKQCLTIDRKDSRNRNSKFYALFYPVSYNRQGTLDSAWIEFDDATTDPTALQGYMAHELGHGLGLENCKNCKKNKSIMNGFRNINRHNGLLSPSLCDLEVVRRVYDEQRRLAAATAESSSGLQNGE